MNTERLSQLSAEELVIFEATEGAYREEIASYIQEGRAFASVSSDSLSQQWLELVLCDAQDAPHLLKQQPGLEVEHLLRGQPLPYDKVLEAGGCVMNLMSQSNKTLDELVNLTQDRHFESDINNSASGIHSYYKRRLKN